MMGVDSIRYLPGVLHHDCKQIYVLCRKIIYDCLQDTGLLALGFVL